MRPPHFHTMASDAAPRLRPVLRLLAERLALSSCGATSERPAGSEEVRASEGIICAGKTTLLSKSDDRSLKFYEDPNAELLDLFYENLDTKPRNPYGFVSQVYFLMKRIMTNQQAAAAAGRRNEFGNQASGPLPVVTDRSLAGDGVFFVLNALLGAYEEPEIEVYFSILKQHQPLLLDKILFLDTPPERAHELVKRRKNKYERSVPLWYLQHLRLVYYCVLRQVALHRRVRIAVVRNYPDFVDPSRLESLYATMPDLDRTCEIWRGSRDLDESSSPDEVQQELDRIADLCCDSSRRSPVHMSDCSSGDE